MNAVLLHEPMVSELPTTPTVSIASQQSIRAQAQSRMTRNGNVAPLPTYAEALAILSQPSPSECLPANVGGGCDSNLEEYA